MRTCLNGAVLLLSLAVAMPAWAQGTDAGKAWRAAPATVPDGMTAHEYHAYVARQMEAKIARQDRAARRAQSSICVGCSGSRGGVRQPGLDPQRRIGPDGLPYGPGDIE